jgi:hypothetical protein
MLLPLEKAIIISGSMFGSIVLFSSALTCMNAISLKPFHRNSYAYQINAAVMFYSAASFGYLTYIALN